MTRKRKAITTDATKHKLPLPKGHPQQRPKRKRPAGSAPTVAPPPSDETCPQPRETGPWCHQIDNGCGSEVCLRTCGPAPDFRAIPCGEDVVITDQPVTIAGAPHKFVFRDAPPDTTPYPWPLKFAWWLDGWLTRLAGWVTP